MSATGSTSGFWALVRYAPKDKYVARRFALGGAIEPHETKPVLRWYYTEQTTSAEYVATGGTQCPFCKSDDIQGGDFSNYGNGEVSQRVDCRKCDATWTDVYVLDRYFE